jgi:flavin-binding protein dodecin
MSVARVTEITSSSKNGFQDAIEKGIDRATKTLKNVEGAWIQDQKIVVEDGKIVAYRVNMKVTFILTD